jgi:hypothetical protein
VPDLFARIVPLLRSVVSRGPRDLLHLPGVNPALWRAGNWQAHLTSAAVISHRYATAVIDVLGFALLALSFAGSLYITIGLTRRVATAGLRWSAGQRGRRLLLAVAGLACLLGLASFWTMQGQFRG